MAERFVTYMTEDAEAGKVPVDGDGVLLPVSWDNLENKPFGVTYSHSLFTLTLDKDTTVHDQYDSIEEQGFTVRQTNMATWTLSKNIGEVYLDDFIGNIAMHTHFPDGKVEEILITENNISSGMLSINTGNAILRLSENGDLELEVIGGAAGYRPMSGFTSIEYQEIKTIAPKYMPKAEYVDRPAGDTPTTDEFMALITSLRNAGYIE